MTSRLFIYLFFVLSESGRDVVKGLPETEAWKTTSPHYQMALLPKALAG